MRSRSTPPRWSKRLGRRRRRAGRAPLAVHLKVDTGMHRVGATPAEALALAKAIDGHPGLALEAVWTHCAVADEPDDPFTARQLERFEPVLAELAAAGIERAVGTRPTRPAPSPTRRSRYDLVRCGIAVYGIPPCPALAGRIALRARRPRCAPGDLRQAGRGRGADLLRAAPPLRRATTVATVPLGYADGVSRRLETRRPGAARRPPRPSPASSRWTS